MAADIRASWGVGGLVAVAAGGAGGAGLRQQLVDLLGPGPQFPIPDASGRFEFFEFPWATLIANGLGCLVLGAVFAAQSAGFGRPRLLLGIGVGFCGSLTTFSAFAVEVAERIHHVGGPYELPIPGPHLALRAGLYLVVSLAVGAAAFIAGGRAARHAAARSEPA